jgi:hypothetical protein
VRAIVFKRRDDGWFRGTVNSWNDFLSSITNVASERFQLPQKLPLVHDGGASVLNEGGCNIVISISIVGVQSAVKILRDPLSAFCESLFIPTGLNINQSKTCSKNE